MNLGNELQKHSAQLLSIGTPWEVKQVALKLAEKQVEIELSWQWGAAAQCPVCWPVMRLSPASDLGQGPAS